MLLHAELIKDMKNNTLVTSIEQVTQAYAHGFRIKAILADGQSKHISGNEQGGHYFLSLHTGKRILRNNWTLLPMPNDVVDAVHRQVAASKQARGITFTNRNAI